MKKIFLFILTPFLVLAQELIDVKTKTSDFNINSDVSMMLNAIYKVDMKNKVDTLNVIVMINFKPNFCIINKFF